MIPWMALQLSQNWGTPQFRQERPPPHGILHYRKRNAKPKKARGKAYVQDARREETTTMSEEGKMSSTEVATPVIEQMAKIPYGDRRTSTLVGIRSVCFIFADFSVEEIARLPRRLSFVKLLCSQLPAMTA